VKDFQSMKTINTQTNEKQSFMTVSYQFHYQDGLTTQRFKERENHTKNLY